AASSGGNTSSNRNAVTNCAHTKNGSRIHVSPFARNWMMVVMKLIAPSNDDVIRKKNPVSHNGWPLKKRLIPGPAPGKAASGVHEVQPLFAAPPGTKKLINMITPPTANAQKLAAFTFGNVMSGAPIWSGTTKFPNAANATGTTPAKIMIVPCIAPNEL